MIYGGEQINMSVIKARKDLKIYKQQSAENLFINF